MTPVYDKLEELYADLWEPHNLPSRLGNIYATIFMYEYIRKTWTLYLLSKDKFVDIFQLWLPQVEVKSDYKMKALQADG